MKTARNRALASIAAAALIFSFSACSNDDGQDQGSSDTKLSGTINGSGASSQVNAQQAWRDNFTKETGVVVNYDPTGSGTGRDQFLAGEVVFAGTDSMLKDEELTKAAERCGDTGVIELPLYISPIAIAFNLEGIDSLNMDAKTIAGIFDGKITKWNDAAIADANPDVELPDADIIPVNRADKSGTTENFQQYLVEAAGDAWPYEADDIWPKEGTQAAEKTSGVVNLVKSTQYSITYADASQIGDLGSVAVEVGDEFLKYSPEAAAAIVDGSEPTANATDQILTVDLKRDGSIKGAYPVVMISYLVACTQYEDASTAANVKAYFEYMASADGQEVAAKANGGNAPISDDLRDKAMAAIAKIAVAAK
ncbi:MAG: phosphate ABC transporter substrate-binding protein PstS [Trueperella sp.]|nr:phosphate ABC transporter substrate-binding protein PstS [Trueperella sp.]